MSSSSFIDTKNWRNGDSLQNFLLFAYSAVVMFALILVVFRNFETPEQIIAEERLAAEEKREKAELASSVSVPEIYDADSADTNNLSPDWDLEIEESEPVAKSEILEVKKGDNFISILQGIGLDYKDAAEITESLKKNGFNVKALRVGQKIEIEKTVDTPFGELISLDKLVIEPVSGTKYIVSRDEDEKYVAEVEQQELKLENRSVVGTINSSLAVAMRNAGVPQTIIGNFINIFAYTVDFRSDIKAGNTFKVLYERKVAPNGQVIKNGDILYAELKLSKNTISLYRYKDLSGGIDYYNDKGTVLKRTLDRKPLEFRSARISSRFGWRRHPILKDRRMHTGVDYAAPKGSRIYASGDGVITHAQFAGGYGNMIVIRHNSEYSTGYSHMNSFARGIRPGVRVKQGQVIGYVGSTGRSTGPHLHFEIIKHGKKVDPLKVKAATGNNLAGKDLALFKKTMVEIQAKADGITEVADAKDVSLNNDLENKSSTLY